MNWGLQAARETSTAPNPVFCVLRRTELMLVEFKRDSARTELRETEARVAEQRRGLQRLTEQEEQQRDVHRVTVLHKQQVCVYVCMCVCVCVCVRACDHRM